MDRYLSNKIKNISFILTILVVILHAYNANNTINIVGFIQKLVSHGIATIAVPIFFVTSGYLFFYKFEPTLDGWISKYKKRFKSLFIPFMIWCTGWMIILYIIQLTPIGNSLFSNMKLSEFSFREILKYTYTYPIPFQLWYIDALIKCVIISPIIYWILKKIGNAAGYILFILWITAILKYPIALFSLGSYLAINHINLDFKMSEKSYKLVVSNFIVLTFISTYISYFDIKNITIINNIVIILGVISIWKGYDKYSSILDKNFEITKYGIFIYFFHEPLQSVIIRVLLKIFGNSSFSHMIVYILSPSITIFLAIYVAKFISRRMENTYAILTGGR